MSVVILFLVTFIIIIRYILTDIYPGLKMQNHDYRTFLSFLILIESKCACYETTFNLILMTHFYLENFFMCHWKFIRKTIVL